MDELSAPRPARRGRRLILLALLAVALTCGWRLARRSAPPVASLPAAPAVAADRGMRLIPGGQFRMGSDLAALEHASPQHAVNLRPFELDPHEVTVAQFAEFVTGTGYVTTAERKGRAWVFELAHHKWTLVAGADWRHPLGPHSTVAGQDDRPVVQVSWFDATAYARWAGKRLPSEAEWEYAARGGLYDADYPWGREEKVDGRFQANYWQGWFPDQDLGLDGFRGVAHVAAFAPNRFGLYDMAGNVWEWCADWFADDYYQLSPTNNPSGPESGARRVQRGGSWLCAENSTRRMRVWTRGCDAPDACHNHVGFRCASDVR